jgi:hypothetical protein
MGSDGRECRWFPLTLRASPASTRGSHAAYQPARDAARSLRSVALHSAPCSASTGRPGNGAPEPRGMGDGPAWRDVLCQGFLSRLSMISTCRARGRALSFVSSRGTKRKKAWQRKKRTAFLCLRRPGRGRAELHCETRSPRPGPTPLTRARGWMPAALRLRAVPFGRDRRPAPDARSGRPQAAGRAWARCAAWKTAAS